jgi:hypothetical protein
MLLLWRQSWVSIGRSSLSLGLNLGDDIGLVDSTLDHLLLLRTQVLGKIFVERRLLLLET